MRGLDCVHSLNYIFHYQPYHALYIHSPFCLLSTNMIFKVGKNQQKYFLFITIGVNMFALLNILVTKHGIFTAELVKIL